MKHITSKIITQIIIYILVIVGIFMLQFTKGKTFSFSIGTMSVAGYYETENSATKKPLLPIHIVSNGINFYANKQNPITAIIDNNETPLKVVSYSNTKDKFTIHCSNSVKLTFSSETRGDVDTTHIRATFPNNITAVKMPWKITQTAQFVRKEEKSFIKYGTDYFEFLGNFGFNKIGVIDFNEEQPRITLTQSEPSGRYRTFVLTKGLDLHDIAEMPGSDQTAYNQAKEKFSIAALHSFNSTIDLKKYNENTLTAYLAEMGLRNMYLTAKNRVKANTLPRTIRTCRSCTFYGNIINNYSKLLEIEKNNRSSISKMISEKNIAVFEFPDLIQYLIDRNSEMLISDLKTVIAENEVSKLTVAQSLGILEAYMQYKLYFPQKENFLEKLTDTCSRKIREALVIIDNGVYLSEDGKTVDTMLTLKASEILCEFGKSSPPWSEVARKIYTSLLAFSGESASLPAKFRITGDDTQNRGIMINDDIILSPEELYPHVITKNNWYPHAQSLALAAEHGIWAWTSAEKIEILESTKYKLSFNVKLVEEGIHYMIIRNIRPFKKIEIHNLDFRTDPRFEIYNSSGYVYNATTSTLYLKLKHKKDIEKITITFK
ncbi:MAG: hypothetical protein CR988_04155 [Treponema sp.]|nr:MAG: hypothetical protein CR988_04155 [Treponema sp.]